MRRGLNIAFFGSSLVSAYWNGAATYYRGMIRALHGSGHRVTFYEPDAYDRQAHRDIPDPPWATVVVYSGAHENGVYGALEAARHADLIIKASGVGVFDALLEQAVLDMKAPGTLAIFWDVDVTATLDRVLQHPEDPFRPPIPRYDMIRAGYPPSIRVFEAAACARPIISDRWQGLETFFTPGKDILIARTPRETLYYLRELPVAERAALGRGARARVLAGHTAAHRAAELEAYIRELSC